MNSLEYGVAWKTHGKDASSVFFSSREKRSKYLKELRRNPLVRQETIAFYIKDATGRTYRDSAT